MVQPDVENILSSLKKQLPYTHQFSPLHLSKKNENTGLTETCAQLSTGGSCL
jgi:hypothetical protein